MLCLLDSDNEKDERKFEHRKSKSMAKARGRCLPMNFTMDDAATGILKERARIGSSLADVDPMNIDSKVKTLCQLSSTFVLSRQNYDYYISHCTCNRKHFLIVELELA